MKKNRKQSEKEFGPPRVSRSDVFDDLGFSSEESAVLKLRSDLHEKIMEAISQKGLSPKKLEAILKQPQPRVSELLCGKISKISAEKLVEYLALLEVPVVVSVNDGDRKAKQKKIEKSVRVEAEKSQITAPMISEGEVITQGVSVVHSTGTHDLKFDANPNSRVVH